MGKKKRQGHYCYICRTYKANEKVIRKFIRDDLDGLYAIMQKPEVMYAGCMVFRRVKQESGSTGN
ncbi:hypothetical protein [Dysgonomonas mossii]|uniref:hypothetical protein n=1 Tax=Dysgonomonas mossii TaxID=163665 RepID=UPI0026F1090B|nr:hypothetical protein [Dysgonomonas mossii]